MAAGFEAGAAADFLEGAVAGLVAGAAAGFLEGAAAGLVAGTVAGFVGAAAGLVAGAVAGLVGAAGTVVGVGCFAGVAWTGWTFALSALIGADGFWTDCFDWFLSYWSFISLSYAFFSLSVASCLSNLYSSSIIAYLCFEIELTAPY